MGIREWICTDYISQRDSTAVQLATCEATKAALQNATGADLQLLQEANRTQGQRIRDLTDQLTNATLAFQQCQSQITEDPKETYWNNKYPKADIRYNCRWIVDKGVNTSIAVDIRDFWQLYDADLKGIAHSILAGLAEKTYDSMALACLRYVRAHLTYTPDLIVEGVDEFWLYPKETLSLSMGDCEDGAILLANLMHHVGIPYWRIRLNAGEINGGGHAYVTYCREIDNEFVTLDWCYEPNDLPVSQRPLHRDQRDYYSIWWSWNVKYCFSKATFEDGK